jgi:hypothetical protein
MPQKGTEKRRSSENVISTDKAALLWMYCKEIAPFETPTFSKNVGDLSLAQHAPLRQAQSDARGGLDKVPYTTRDVLKRDESSGRL